MGPRIKNVLPASNPMSTIYMALASILLTEAHVGEVQGSFCDTVGSSDIANIPIFKTYMYIHIYVYIHIRID